MVFFVHGDLYEFKFYLFLDVGLLENVLYAIHVRKSDDVQLRDIRLPNNGNLIANGSDMSFRNKNDIILGKISHIMQTQ